MGTCISTCISTCNKSGQDSMNKVVNTDESIENFRKYVRNKNKLPEKNKPIDKFKPLKIV